MFGYTSTVIGELSTVMLYIFALRICIFANDEKLTVVTSGTLGPYKHNANIALDATV
jgi:hypothetical protein